MSTISKANNDQRQNIVELLKAESLTVNDLPKELQASSAFSHVCPVSAMVMKKLIE